MNCVSIESKLKLRSGFFITCILIPFTIVQITAQEPVNPPIGCDPCKDSELVELVKLDSTIKLDLRYATDNNFLGKAVYHEPRAFLQQPAAEALILAHNWLKKQGYGLVIYDAYRPWSVTKLFWDMTPPDERVFVANPSTGSVHNRGCAVDVGLYKISTGCEVEMPSGFDDFSERSFVTYSGGTVEQRTHRNILRKAMEQDGYFFVSPEEWWHYNFKDFREYPILDIPFSDIKSPTKSN